jgi:hypothetical protein
MAVRLMYDSVSASTLPSGCLLVAGYVNGAYENVAEMEARFPHATVVPVTVTAAFDGGTVLDVETGDATPVEAPAWVQMRRAAGVDPSVYCDESTWPAVQQSFAAAGVAPPHYWIASYDNDPAIPAGAVAKQYASNDYYDTSSVAEYWPGVDPIPEEDMPLNAADEAAIKSIVTEAITANRPVAVADTLYWMAAAVTGNPPAGGVSPVDEHSIAELHAALVAGPSAQIAALSAKVVAAEAALAAVEKGALTVAEVQAAVAAALAAAGHVVAA